MVRKYLSIDGIRSILVQADTPISVTAFSFGAGLFIAFTPLIGMHLILCFFLSRIIRVNNIVMLAAAFVNNPWTIVPIHLSGLVVGDLIFHGRLESMGHFKSIPLGEIGLRGLFNGQFWHTYQDQLLSILWPFLIGNLVLSTVFGTLGYYLARKSLEKLQKRYKKAKPT